MKLKITKLFAPETAEIQVFDLADEKTIYTLINDGEEMDLVEFIESAKIVSELLR